MMPASSDDGLQSSLTSSSSSSCEREAKDPSHLAADSPGRALDSSSRASTGAPRIRNENAKKGKGKVGGCDQTAKQRERFIIFIRILFKCIDETDPQLRPLAKRIVKECTLRNREGHPDYQPLVEAVQSRLQGVVGDTHWNRAEEYLRYFVATRQRTARGRQALSPNRMDKKLE